VEASSARLFEARGLCQAFHKELEEQDRMLSKNIDIVQRHDDNLGNVDPNYEDKKVKWTKN
jgi:hypothetical protein